MDIEKASDKMFLIKLTKSCTFLANTSIWVLAFALLAISVFAEVELHKYVDLSPEFTESAPHVLMGIAVLMLLVSSIAFSCIIKGQPVLLYMYAGLLGCMSMMILGTYVAIGCYRDSFPKGLYDGLTGSISTYTAQKGSFDLVQSKMECCGVSNYTDWIRLSPQKVVPISCCVNPNQCVTANYAEIYRQGCFGVFMNLIESHIWAIIGAVTLVATIPLVGLLLACCLATLIKRKNILMEPVGN